MLLSNSSLSVQVTNLTENDARFLRSLLAIFTDPKSGRMSQELRSGRLAIQYSPDDGQIAWIDFASDMVPTPGEMIQFVARFQDHEWETLQANAGFRGALRRDLTEAEEIAKEVLGYLPQKVRFEVVEG
ncbi:MAG: hypothetical protein ACK4UN_05455 [Limisphaerales bacterium]